MNRRALAVLAAVLLIVPVTVAARGPNYQAQINALTARVAALEAAVWSPTPTVAPTATPNPTPTVPPTPTPTASPSLTPSPTAFPTPTSTPTDTPTVTIRVTSIAALLNALADNSVTDITVADGTYHVSAAGLQRSDSLWIGFAGRANPVTIRAETPGGVTFDGGGVLYFGCISFENGAHDQTWVGFRCANGQATETGIITFGGYAGLAAPHHITLADWMIDGSCTGRATSISAPTTDHAVYFSQAVGGPHDITIDGLTVDGSGYLASAVHFYHHDAANANAWNVTIRDLTVTGTQQAIIIWDSTLHDILVDGARVTNALDVAVRYEDPGTRITVANVTSTGSGQAGFYSSLGANPPGLTLVNDELH